MESLPRRVQYELSKTSNTVSASLNTDQADHPASREPRSALHGEHHNVYLHQVNDPSHHEVSAECSYGADANQVYPTDNPSCQEVAANPSNGYSYAVNYGADSDWEHSTTQNPSHETNDISHQEATAGSGYGAATDHGGNIHRRHLNNHDLCHQTNDATTSRRGYIVMASLPTTAYQTDDTTSYVAAAECNYDCNAVTDNGVDATTGYDSFTSDESEQHPTANDETPTNEAVYAVANKARPATTA